MAILMILSVLLLYISFHTSSAFFHKISLLSYKIKEQTRTSTTSHKMSSLILNNNEPDDDNNKLEEVEDAFGAAIGPLPTVSSKINFGDQTPKNIKHGN